ncbi:MAG: serine/threonine-protein kinase [Rhodoferax sp.]
MAKSFVSESGAFWRTGGFAGLVMVVLVIGLHLASDSIGALERRYYDFASSRTARQPSERIAVIAVDEPSIAKLGRWPWSGDIHARLIDQLAAARVTTLVYAVPFLEPHVDPGLVYIRKMQAALETSPDAAAAHPQWGQMLAEAERALDTDAVLAASIKNAGNVLLPTIYTLGAARGEAANALPPYALKSAIDDPAGFALPALRGQPPVESLGRVAAGIGHWERLPDAEEAPHREPLLLHSGGKAVPSLALLAAAHSLGLRGADVRPLGGDAVQLGPLRIPTDSAARMLPQLYPERAGKSVFAPDAFYDVLSGKIPASRYADKIVIIGMTAESAGGPFLALGNGALSPVERIARATSSILSGQVIAQPRWGDWVTWVACLLAAVYVVAVVPRLAMRVVVVATPVLFTALLVLEWGGLAVTATWIPLVLAATVLVLGSLAVVAQRLLMAGTPAGHTDAGPAESHHMMGLALQGQGQLDMAFDRFRRVPLTDAIMGDLYNLAADFERKHQFGKAQAVYAHMAAFDDRYKDIQAKRDRVGAPAEAVLDQPMLGRYQIEKELGQGAMGVVYRGRDPKIGRVVAIKTLALSAEFGGDDLVDARARFFREAETAGRLQHPNIVTIFDAGEEHGLAYIAMEFLKGRDLAVYCRADQLLPVPVVLGIVARVADALAYAHLHNVVHRDVKPANIMYEPESDTVKVTDFGIARMTDSSKTRTGLVLGTPSYMSPEQLAGKKVDGRSDLYSLGVMLFQLLTGVLPFRGDSMGSLMYAIANDEAPDVRLMRPELPPALADVVARALSKRPEMRYATGLQFAADVRRVMEHLPGGRMPLAAAQPVATDAAPDKAAAFAATIPSTQVVFEKTVIQPVAGSASASGGDAATTGH